MAPRVRPRPVSDLKWWTGWSAGDVKKAVAALDTAEVDLGGGATGLVLADDTAPTDPPEPWAALLPALDPTPMGWQERSWFLGDHGPALFDTSGNIGPTVWWDGRIVGGWAQRADGEIAVRLLEDAGAEARAAVDAEAARTAAWYGDVRATPRFRTPSNASCPPSGASRRSPLRPARGIREDGPMPADRMLPTPRPKS
nr:crosslink repair DNA glycosylase YcaQ family protein [Actinomadura sp. J1-007]